MYVVFTTVVSCSILGDLTNRILFLICFSVHKRANPICLLYSNYIRELTDYRMSNPLVHIPCLHDSLRQFASHGGWCMPSFLLRSFIPTSSLSL